MQCQIILRHIWTSDKVLRLRYLPVRRHSTGHGPRSFITKTISKLHQETNDPLWSLIPLVHNGPIHQLTRALRKATVPLDEFKLWQQCIQQRTLAQALDLAPKSQTSIPHWVLFHLLANKVNTLNDALDPLLDLILSQLPSYPAHLRAAALILSAAHLSTRELLIPLRAVLDEFLLLPRGISTPKYPSTRGSTPSANGATLNFDGNPFYELYVNLFLRALAQVPKHSELYRDYIVTTMVAMVNGPLDIPISKPHPDTYSAMLRIGDGRLQTPLQGDRVAGYRLARFLQNRMELDGLSPGPEHTEAFDHYFASAQAEKDKKTKRQEERFETGEDDEGKEALTNWKQRTHSAKPTLLSSQRHDPIKYAHVLRSPHAGIWMGKRTSMDEKDVIAILDLAAKDMKLKTDDFVDLFRRISRAPRQIGGFERLQASMETYGILLQGLMYRKELQRALQFCHFLFENSGLPLNKEVVTLGVRILTQAGRVGSAIELVESVTPQRPLLSNSAVDSAAISPVPPVPSGALDISIPLLEPVQLDATTINVWMHSLRRIGRPDAVLALWDDMYTLYGIVHTNATLNIMLETARSLALRNERSIRRQFAKYFSFKRKAETSAEGFELKETDQATSAEAQERLLIVTGQKAKGGGKWTAGLWRGDQPEETARKVFLQIMFGMDLARNPNGFHSPTPTDVIKAPARSVRRNWDSGGGMVGLGVALPSLKMERYQFDVGKEMYRWVPAPGPPPDTNNPVPRPHYPHLALDDSNFFDYLCLLSVTQRTTEVALTMAWMRHLRIYPSQATLALSMVLWGEISVEAPIVQSLSTLGRSGEQGSEGDSRPMDEYERFVHWLGGWVGKERIPQDHVLRNFRVVVKNIRNSESAPRMKKPPKRPR